MKGESPADVAIFAIRPPGKEAFARGMKDDEVLAVRGPTEIPLAFYLPEAAEELRISTRGFQTMPVDVKQAE